jgi:DNA-binding NtrC family response regulator
VNVLTVEVPPLRVRGADIALLARHFLATAAGRYGLLPKQLSAEAEALLLAYPWPGNVRELAHMMERAALLHGDPVVSPEHLGLGDVRTRAPVVVGPGKDVTVDFSSGGIVLDDVERQLIVEALEVARWNRTRAAGLLGISKETLRYRMEKFRLSPTE